jgi:hypothetical protein
MKVLGHDHISDDYKLIAAPDQLKNGEKQVAPASRANERLPLEKTTREGREGSRETNRSLISIE